MNMERYVNSLDVRDDLFEWGDYEEMEADFERWFKNELVGFREEDEDMMSEEDTYIVDIE